MKNTDPLMGAKLKSKAAIKKAEFYAGFESVEKVIKKCTKTSLTNMSKT
jgi:hypothetical protein